MYCIFCFLRSIIGYSVTNVSKWLCGFKHELTLYTEFNYFIVHEKQTPAAPNFRRPGFQWLLHFWDDAIDRPQSDGQALMARFLAAGV